MSIESQSAKLPLYLLADSTRLIRADVTALLVTCEGVTPRRYPFRRLSRIVCNHRIDWTGEAVARCLAHGISIQWLDLENRPIGVVRPKSANPDELGVVIEAAMECKIWQARYSDWLRHERMRILQIHGRELNAALVAEAVYRDRLPERLAATARAACSSFVTAAIYRAGLRDAYMSPEAVTLRLAEDITRLIELELVLSFALATESDEAILMVTEGWLATDPMRVPRLIARLIRAASAWIED